MTMKVTITSECGEYATFTFRPGEFETVSPGTWVDQDGDEVSSDYSAALASLACCLSEDVYAGAADRAIGAQAMFVRTYR
jgi:hypothetical protein